MLNDHHFFVNRSIRHWADKRLKRSASFGIRWQLLLSILFLSLFWSPTDAISGQTEILNGTLLLTSAHCNSYKNWKIYNIRAFLKWLTHFPFQSFPFQKLNLEPMTQKPVILNIHSITLFPELVEDPKLWDGSWIGVKYYFYPLSVLMSSYSTALSQPIPFYLIQKKPFSSFLDKEEYSEVPSVEQELNLIHAKQFVYRSLMPTSLSGFDPSSAAGGQSGLSLDYLSLSPGEFFFLYGQTLQLTRTGVQGFFKALKYYHKAAELGYERAEEYLGGIRFIRTCRAYLEKEAQVTPSFYAQMLETTEPDEPTLESARKSIQFLAGQKCAHAQHLYAEILLAENQRNLAMRYFHHAAEKGLAASQERYAKLLLEETKPRRAAKALSIATDYLKQAADQGLAESQFAYATLLQSDPDQAVVARAYFKRAFEQGHLLALVEYGKMLEQGIGGDRDPLQAVQCYQQVAAQGSPEVSLFFQWLAEPYEKISLQDPSFLEQKDLALEGVPFSFQINPPENKAEFVWRHSPFETDSSLLRDLSHFKD